MKKCFALLFALALSRGADAQQITPNLPPAAQAIARVRPPCPIRLGGVFTRGLAGSLDFMEDSAALGIKLSEENRAWMARNCDVAAFPATCLNTDTFPKTLQEQTLFTPLLLAFASTLSEKPNVWGDVGGWQPRMSAWTLRDKKGHEVVPPQENSHWMDFANPDWAAHWKKQIAAQVNTCNAAGVVVAELPLANTAVSDDLAKYPAPADRAAATGDWLRIVKKDAPFLVVPSALGFDRVAGHPTLPVPAGMERDALNGSFWDEFFSVSDGAAWDEGFLAPYWTDLMPSEEVREMHLEAAERASLTGQPFIVAGAYHNDDELEFLLASYLLIAHRQGRLVFQPMPLLPFFDRDDAGHSFAVFKQQIISRRAYFDVPLGYAMQNRHIIVGMAARVWQRDYSNGEVFVNSEDTRSAVLHFAGNMKRVTGELLHEVTLPPRSGLILLYSDAKTKG